MNYQKYLKWIVRILGSIVGVIILALLIAGLVPVPTDVLPSPDDYGAGALSVDPSVTGLLREFPQLTGMSNNPASPEKEKLGRLLFFDPILSEENDIACATCHHPDLGYTDGLPRAIGAGGSGVGPARTGGIELARNAPSLWNAGYTNLLFWDGRVNSLEYQVLVPISHMDEMGVSNTNTLEDDLKAIPEYVDLFDAAFGRGVDGITIKNVTNALATFERTIITNNSPFDEYAAGDVGALSAAQRRGLNLFRSAATRCFECHAIPTFSTETFRVIGVPDVDGFPHDAGRAAVVASGVDGAFKVPTLRNIALSGPYMHNGVFSTLEEVIEFYADGGDRADDVENMDPFIQGFELTEQQKEDLIAFLFALTDESSLTDIPERVPSGVDVVPHITNPAREIAATYNLPSFSAREISEGEQLITLRPGENLQDAVDRARPGDTIQIPFGTYHEQIAIDFNDITLLGMPNAAGDWPTLDGQNDLAEAITASGNNLEIAFLNVINYTDTGILVEGVTGVYLHDLYVENTGIYGLYPVKSTDVLIENTEVIGANDAGIYAGQCVNVTVRDNVVYGNVLGIEVENTVGAEVYGNHAYNNTVGIFIDLLPQLTAQVSLNTKVYDNRLENNNHENFAKEGTAVSIVPPGAGIVILAADKVTIFDNLITNHKTAGIGIFHMSIGFDEAEINVGPTPEHIRIYGNTFENNGYDPDEFLISQRIPGADILWDISGWDVRIDQPEAEVFPPLVPTSDWSTFFYNMYWNVLNLLMGLL